MIFSTRPWPPSGLRKFPQFQKLPGIDLYFLIQRSFENCSLDPWPRWYMDGRKQRLEPVTPILDFDWSGVDGSSFG